MALVGNIRDFGLSDFLYLIDRGDKSGRLQLSHLQEKVLLFFEQGRLLLAVDRPAEQQGDLLVRLGLINALQLEQARQQLRAQPQTTNLTQMIITLGFVSSEQLQRALQQHIEQIVYNLFSWPEGEFHFEQNQRPPPDTPTLPRALTVDRLIIEGVRRIDEWGEIRNRIPSSDLVVRLVALPDQQIPKLQLSAEEWRVMARINGNYTLAEIARKNQRSEFDICRIVYGFLTTGLVEVGRKQTGADQSATPTEIPRIKRALVDRIINRLKSI